MKRFIVLACLTVFFYTSSAQTELPASEKLTSLCKVWGFLKYYHPEVAKGKFNWDEQLLDRINQLGSLQNKKELSNFYLDWINNLGQVKECKKCDRMPKNAFTKNFDLHWINDSTLFSQSLIERLNYIKENRNQDSNYYVSTVKGIGNTIFKNEEAYKDSIYPSVNMRLLSLFRYWNIINYFFPYKYKTDEDWNKVLTDMIPLFENSGDTTDYNLAILELAAKTDDSHAMFSGTYLSGFFGKGGFPFFIKLINDSAVITHIVNDSLAKIDDIHYGDVITKINSRTISEIKKDVYKYIPASNASVNNRNFTTMDFYFAGNPSNEVEVTYIRNGVENKKFMHRYSYKNMDFKPAPEKTYKILEDGIGYINLGMLTAGEVRSVVEKLKNTKAIILDVRNYPKNTLYMLSQVLNKRRMPFAKFTTPDITYPGMFSFGKPIYTAGRRNNNYYKGKIVLLVNETTQSHAEFTCMALQTAPDVTIIGSQTAGADGNVSLITLPGGYSLYMTGIGVYYPDGKETQRIGIVPDIIVKPTIKGIQGHKDEVLDRAIKFLEGTKLMSGYSHKME